MKRILSFVLVAFIALSLLTGCSGGKEADVADIRSELSSIGFEIDVLSDIKEGIGLVMVYEADNDDFEINIAEFDTEENAAAYFQEIKNSIFERESELENVEAAIGDTSESYKADGSDKFYCLARKGNVMLTCVSDLKYRSSVLGVFGDLGFGE